MGDLLGRLHALPLDASVNRHGGASGDDPSREGSPRQDLLAGRGQPPKVDWFEPDYIRAAAAATRAALRR